MKRILILCLAALLVGCGTTPDERCQTYRASYELYRTASLTLLMAALEAIDGQNSTSERTVFVRELLRRLKEKEVKP